MARGALFKALIAVGAFFAGLIAPGDTRAQDDDLASSARISCRAEIIEAFYNRPTTRYDHGVLGDAIEWGGLVLNLRGESPCGGEVTRREVVLPESLVFEDTSPRLADLDGDGQAEVITVETSLTRGARLTVWGVRDEAIGRLASTPFIGRPHRWLAPVGAADLDGDGLVEIAFVDRPHLAQVLRIWRYRAGRLSEIATLQGLSNHRIGWPDIPGGIRDCGDGPEMVLADGGFRRVLAARLEAGVVETRVLAGFAGPESLDAALTCPR